MAYFPKTVSGCATVAYNLESCSITRCINIPIRHKDINRPKNKNRSRRHDHELKLITEMLESLCIGEFSGCVLNPLMEVNKRLGDEGSLNWRRGNAFLVFVS